MPAVRICFATACAIVVAVALLLAPTMPAGAASGPTSYATTVFMSEKPPAFHGRLRSPSHFCVADRPVRVYRERSGPDKLLGRTRSGEDGSWEIPITGNLASGIYLTLVPRYAGASRGIVCRPGRSQVAVLD